MLSKILKVGVDVTIQSYESIQKEKVTIFNFVVQENLRIRRKYIVCSSVNGFKQV